MPNKNFNDIIYQKKHQLKNDFQKMLLYASSVTCTYNCAHIITNFLVPVFF